MYTPEDAHLVLPAQDGAQHEWVTPLYLASIHGHPDVIEVPRGPRAIGFFQGADSAAVD